MKLLTKDIERRLPALYATDGETVKDVIAKYFTPDSNWTWYVFEGEKEDDDVRFFGMVEGFEAEMGYFMLSDLEKARGPLGLPVERDKWFSGRYDVENKKVVA